MTSVHDCDMITQMKAPAVTSPGPGPDSRGSQQEVRRFNCDDSIHKGRRRREISLEAGRHDRGAMNGRFRSIPLAFVSLIIAFCLSCASPPTRKTALKPLETRSPLSGVILTEEKHSVDVPSDVSKALRDNLDAYLYEFQSFISWPNLRITYSIIRFDPERISHDISGQSSNRDDLIVVEAKYESSGKEISNILAEERIKGPQSIYWAVKGCAWKIALHATRNARHESRDETEREQEMKTRTGNEITKGWWKSNRED